MHHKVELVELGQDLLRPKIATELDVEFAIEAGGRVDHKVAMIYRCAAHLTLNLVEVRVIATHVELARKLVANEELWLNLLREPITRNLLQCHRTLNLEN